MLDATQGIQVRAESELGVANAWIMLIDGEAVSSSFDQEVDHNPQLPTVHYGGSCPAVDVPAPADNDHAIGDMFGDALAVTATIGRTDMNNVTGEAGANRYVHAVAGDTEVYFDTWYGGTPTTYARDGVNLIDSFAGSGFGANINTGQDGTQASASGIHFNRIALHNDPATMQQFNYYGRETGLESNSDGSVSYLVTGFLPNFWQSQLSPG